MGLLDVSNTVTRLTMPPANDIEVTFGLAAIKLLEAGDNASIKKLMKLREQIKSSYAEIDKLLEDAGVNS